MGLEWGSSRRENPNPREQNRKAVGLNRKTFFRCSSQVFPLADSGLDRDSLTDIMAASSKDIHLSGFESNIYIYIYKSFSE